LATNLATGWKFANRSRAYWAKPYLDVALDNHHLHNLSRELHQHLQRQVHWKTIELRLLIGSCLLAVVVWFGRHAVEDIQAMETWITGHGVWGWIAFVGMVVVFTSIFVPDTLLAISAGALFGLGLGTVLTVVGTVLTTALNFLTARSLLQPRIEKMLEQHPKLRAIQNAAKHEGLRLQLLLRLAPINPVSVSYVLGASGVRFSTFLLATVGLIPALFVEVYFGYLASHVTTVAGNASEHSTLHTVMTVIGFVVCIVLMIYISRVASRAITEAEIDSVA
jgi:uncharacterized membrane protein YdjX (TVP38/TMEM64 family)